MLLDLTIIGLAITFEPIPLTAFIIILASRRGSTKGAAFVSGWIVSLAIVGTVTVLATGTTRRKRIPPVTRRAGSQDRLGCGTRRNRSPALPTVGPAQGAEEDSQVASRSRQHVAPVCNGAGTARAALGFDHSRSGNRGRGKALWLGRLPRLVYFCLLATALYLAMEIYAVARPAETQSFLMRLRSWIDRNTDALIVWVSLIAGLWLMGKSIYLLVT